MTPSDSSVTSAALTTASPIDSDRASALAVVGPAIAIRPRRISTIASPRVPVNPLDSSDNVVPWGVDDDVGCRVRDRGGAIGGSSVAAGWIVRISRNRSAATNIDWRRPAAAPTLADPGGPADPLRVETVAW